MDAWQEAKLYSDAASYDDLLCNIETFCTEMEITPEELDLLWRMRVQPRVCSGEFFLRRPTRKPIGPGWLFRRGSKGHYNIVSVDNGIYGGPEPPRFYPGQTVRCIDMSFVTRAGKVGVVQKVTGKGVYFIHFDDASSTCAEYQLEEA